MTLSASGITHFYGDHMVLCAAGFAALEPGQVTALIGPNASGKSTLFRALSGLIKPVDGDVLLDGTNLGTLTTKERLKRWCRS